MCILINAVWYDMLRLNILFLGRASKYLGVYYEKLPVGLIARLVEHCIGTVFAEVMGWNPLQA